MKLLNFSFGILICLIACKSQKGNSNLEKVNARIEQVCDNNTVLVRFNFRNKIYRKSLPLSVINSVDIQKGEFNFKVDYDRENKFKKIIYKSQQPLSQTGNDIDLMKENIIIGDYTNVAGESLNSDIKHIAIHVLTAKGTVNTGNYTNYEKWDLTTSKGIILNTICSTGINTFLNTQNNLDNQKVYIHYLDSTNIDSQKYYILSSASLFSDHEHID